MGAAIYAWVPNPIERLGMMARAASAIAEARGKGWSSWGLTNAYQHCLMMCYFCGYVGRGTAAAVGFTYEYLQGNSYDDAMDAHNNAMGLESTAAERQIATSVACSYCDMDYLLVQ